MDGPFELMSVIHLVRPAGDRAGDLEALRAGIARAEPATLFYHALQHPLRRPDSDEARDDDWSTWVRGVVQDGETAEHLAYAVQHRAGSADELREALLEALGAVPEKARAVRAAPAGAEFTFLTVESVPVPTGCVAHDAAELMTGLEDADLNAWFYHLFEQPWFAGGPPALTQWLAARGAARLARAIEDEAKSGRGLLTLRRRVLRRWRQRRLGSRIAAAAGATEGDRRDTERAAVAGLVRRITRTDEP
ncbi:MAG: hypothetical protein HY076_02310 [Candidatus Eisenbacteria bacterium]|uniref:Uncharacterized protein n=1 Tax=Eiseniibacteriota bacterium TaxID=2212470 RepID=A0A9D6QJC2_UNCEI|nr:hypothetical protein [Candidatus Eisenbacteria bacterium]MBI3539090.1 hypothetical protein [Candidatus Eisenbacteria bacterium]